MARIFIKKSLTPIILSEERAQKIKEKWFDKTIPQDYKFSFNDRIDSFLKSEIKSIMSDPPDTRKKYIPEPKPDPKETQKSLDEMRKFLKDKQIILS